MRAMVSRWHVRRTPRSGLIARSRGAWDALRRRVLDEAGWACELCGNPASEVDHRIPLALGGTDDRWNLRAVCRTCHRRLTAALRRRRGGGSKTSPRTPGSAPPRLLRTRPGFRPSPEVTDGSTRTAAADCS
jgi:5-methylcytosine-specific restriction protein A